MGDRVTKEVLKALAEREPGLLLDVPAGNSPVAAGARELGYRVVGLDLFPTPGHEGVQADACAPLPFRDASFDCLVSLEGIEHFENQAGFVRECARVLKPGGTMVLTTPNVLHLSARASAFWTGQRVMKRGFVNEDQTLRSREGGRTYHGHAFLIDVFRLRYLMAIEGLKVTGLRHGNRSSGSVFLAPVVPLVWVATRLALSSGKRSREKEGLTAARPEVAAELKKLADSPALLFSRKLVVTAEKRNGGA